MLSSLPSFYSIIFSSTRQVFVKCLLTIMGFLLLSTLLCVVWVKIPYQRCPTVEWVAQRALVGFLIDREWRVHSILPLHSKTLAGETVTIVSRTKWNESVRFLTIPWKFSGSKEKGIFISRKVQWICSITLHAATFI